MESKSSNGTGENLYKQWGNPSDITSLLMVIGGDVVQKALAAGTGTSWFTPVCFSFGWVSYAFVALVNVIGSGCLMPQPDCSIKVINLDSGHSRQNSNWALGRFVRDSESALARECLQKKKSPNDSEAQQGPLPTAVRITVYDSSIKNNASMSKNLSLRRIHLIGLLCIILQLSLAIAPVVVLGEWDIMMITFIGTLLVQLAGCLPQWKVEKLPNRKLSKGKKKAIALTRGNGSLDVIVILAGDGGTGQRYWDLEAFAAPNNPRVQRGWAPPGRTEGSDQPESPLEKMRLDFPIGYWLTLVVVSCQTILWLALLVNVTSERGMDWILIAIGVIGVFQNAHLAGMERDENDLNLQLVKKGTIEAPKVMDGTMDFEVVYGRGKYLRDEFFNGELRDDESRWWNGDRKDYDERRVKEYNAPEGKRKRTLPRVSQVSDHGEGNQEPLANGHDSSQRHLAETSSEPVNPS